MILLGATSCVSNDMRNAQGSGRVNATTSAAPRWVGEPLGWAKLEEIERWLQYEVNSYDPSWRLQAELALSEGRLTYAKREAPAGSPSNAWLSRLRSSQAGFERVLSDPLRSSSHEERARHGLDEIDSLRGLATRQPAATPRDGAILARAQWRARKPVSSRLDPAKGTYNRITIHHTAEVPGTRFDGSLSDSIDVMRTVQRVHMDNRNYGDIGYHFLVDSQGRIFEGRSLRYQGAHAGGANNRRNLGICLIGNFEHRSPSAKAMNTLDDLLRTLRRKHGIARSAIVGHGELKATECPGPSLARWTRNYRTQGPRMAQLGAPSATTRVASSKNTAARRSPVAARNSSWSRGSVVK